VGVPRTPSWWSPSVSDRGRDWSAWVGNTSGGDFANFRIVPAALEPAHGTYWYAGHQLVLQSARVRMARLLIESLGPPSPELGCSHVPPLLARSPHGRWKLFGRDVSTSSSPLSSVHSRQMQRERVALRRLTNAARDRRRTSPSSRSRSPKPKSRKRAARARQSAGAARPRPRTLANNRSRLEEPAAYETQLTQPR